MFMSFFLTCKAPLVAGDIVKIDLGCHIDGFIAVAAHTCIVPESADSPPAVPSNKAIGTVAVAAYNAMLVAAASITAGAKSKEVTAAVERVANAYGVKPIASVRMHQMKRYVLDGVKEVALKTPSPDDPEEEQLPECTFEQNEVYAIDVAMSTGDGNARPGTLRTTVSNVMSINNTPLRYKRVVHYWRRWTRNIRHYRLHCVTYLIYARPGWVYQNAFHMDF
jgi:methionine aminopeptidase